MSFRALLAMLALLCIATPVIAREAPPPTLEFASPEHEFLGAGVYLSLADGSRVRGDRAALLRVRVPGNRDVELSYAELLYLSADYYGVPYVPISGGAGFDVFEPRPGPAQLAARAALERNMLAFAYRGYAAYLPRLRELERGLMQDFEAARADDRPLPYSTEQDCEFMLATGADACVQGPGDLFNLRSFLGQYMELATRSNDHFHAPGQTAFLLGTRMALEQALSASGPDDLRRAYVVAAYAGHFGSDAFAAGHLRTDKRAINTYCEAQLARYGFDGWNGLLLSGLLVKQMHDRDNASGIVVTGRDGSRWTAYGDRYASLRAHDADAARATAALQWAVDRVHQAYAGRGEIDPETWIPATLRQLQQMLPDIDATSADTEHNAPPLFQAQGDRMLWNDPELGTRELDCFSAATHYARRQRGPAATGADSLTPTDAGAHAARSIDVTAELAPGPEPHKLVCEWAKRQHGDFPSAEGAFTSRVLAHLESNGVATGAEGDLYCLVLTPDARDVPCQFTVHFDNPFVGGDSHELLDRQGSCTVDIDERGRGDNWRPLIRIGAPTSPRPTPRGAEPAGLHAGP